MQRWCNTWTHYDLPADRGGRQRPESVTNWVHRIMQETSLTKDSSLHDARKRIAQGCLRDYIFMRSDRPTFFVPSFMADLMLAGSISPEVVAKQVKYPYDVFSLVFERGFEIVPGIPLRWIQLSNLRSKLARQWFLELFEGPALEVGESPGGLADAMMGGYANMLQFLIDIGRTGPGEFSHDARPVDVAVMLSQHLLDKPWLSDHRRTAEDKLGKVSDEEQQLSIRIEHLVLSLLLRMTCRPEMMVPLVLPRSDRYNFKGNRKAFRIFHYDAKRVCDNRPDNTGEPKWKVRPHVRGFVYRTLRSDRYRRNPDGTHRIVEVEPCVIHPEEFKPT